MQQEIRTKISGLIINDQKQLLIFRNENSEIWTCPGGKTEPGETDIECLARELYEEAHIELNEATFLLETPPELAAGSSNKLVIMKFYIVEKYTGTPQLNPDDSVAEMKWISRSEYENRDFEIGSGLTKFAIPRLIELGRF